MTDIAESPAVTDFADTFVRFMRTHRRARARWLAEAEHNVEWTAHAVLSVLNAEGPMRAGAIADHLQFDPSTVSRQVATLVKDGLVERRADPEDGRASVLVLTAAADAVLAEHQRVRASYFAGLLEGWGAGEIDDFTDKLARLTAAYEKGNEA